MSHTFSMGGRSGLQAGQSRTELFHYNDVVACAECGLALYLLSKKGRPWINMVLMAPCVCTYAQKLYASSSINGAFTHAMDANLPPYIHRFWLLNFALVIIFLSHVHRYVHTPFKMWTPLHFASVQLGWARVQRRHRPLWMLCAILLCVVESSLAFVDADVDAIVFQCPKAHAVISM